MIELLEFNKKFTFPDVVLLAKKSAVPLLLVLEGLHEGNDLIVEEDALKESK